MPKTKSATKAKSSTKPAAKAASAATSRTTVTRTVSASRQNYRHVLTRKFRNDISLGALLAELLASFGLVALLLSTNANAIVAGIGVLVFTMAFSRISGGHVNPAITIGMLATRQISLLRASTYIVAQLLGAMLALVVISQFTSTAAGVPNPYTGEVTQPQVFKLTELVGDWRPFFGELLGAIVFGLGAGAAIFSKRQGLEAGYLIGGALMLGLLLATQGSNAVLNPAAALGLQGYSGNLWTTLGVYALAPVVGVTVGMWLYRFMQWEDDTAKEAA